MAENPNDLCSQPSEGSISSNAQLNSSQSSSSSNNSSSNSSNTTTNSNNSSSNSVTTTDKNGALDFSPLTKSIKEQVDKLIDPLTKKPTKSGKYWSLEKIDDEEYVETWTEIYSYELINLDPDNPWDQYYRDPDPNIWQKNREANTNEIAANIQELHNSIVEPIRTRVKMVFGDNVFIKTELCFMSKAALTKYGLRSDHIHGKGKAIVLRIENERASMIYDDILDWCSDKTDDELMDYAKTDAEKSLEPIEYGMLKLCNTESEDQFIYITLPFTDSELEKDELLIHNKSNFYYTESNDFKMAPEPDTSTKIFPAYYEDNNVEDVFNKIDDLDDEYNRKEKEIQKAIKNNSNSSTLEKLETELFELEFEKNELTNPSNLSNLELEKKKLTLLNERYPNSQNELNLSKLNSKIARYPTFDDTFSETIKKINSLELYLPIENNLDFNSEDYFNARRLIAIKIALNCIELDVFEPNEEEINKIIEEAKSLYNNTYKERQKALYNEKVAELYPNGFSNVDNIPYIEVNYSNIDMSDCVVPSRDEVIEMQKEEFDKRADLLIDVYESMDFLKLENVNIDTKMNLITYTEAELVNIENDEYKKFDTLSSLIKLNEKKLTNIEKNNILSTYKKLDQFIIGENIDSNFLSLLDTDLDFKIVRTYYFSNKSTSDPDEELKIEKSILFSDILIEKDFDITSTPSINTIEYAEFALKYLECEIELYKRLNDTEKVNSLTEILDRWLSDKENYIYSNIELSTIQSDLYLYTLLEYNSAKFSMIKELSIDESDFDVMIINKLALYQINYRSDLSENVSYTACSYIGKESFSDQSIYLLLDSCLNNEEWRIKNEISIENLSSSTIDEFNRIMNYIESKINILNDYLSSFNDYMLDNLYTEDNNIIINRLFKENIEKFSFIDYGTEYESLFTQIGDLRLDKDKSKNEIDYMTELKLTRIKRKRELSYITSNENNKKIQNYLDELTSDIKFGKINKYKQITEKIIPELKRVNELRDYYNSIKPVDTTYEEKRELERLRKEFLWRRDVNNKYLLFNYLTSDITMDFNNNKGLFNNTFVNEEEKYLLYLKNMLSILREDNNSLMLSEIEQIEKEIAYLLNENGERIATKDKIILEIEEKKRNISKEIEKRKSDPLYNHYTIWKSSLEESMKLKYKDFIRIESLPSTGPVFKYPFYLFDELKNEYISFIRLSSDRVISDVEIIDLYRVYSSINYNIFEIEKNFYFNEIDNLWKKANYQPEKNTFTSDVRQYALCIREGVDNTIQKSIAYCIKSLYGFVNMQPLSINENNIGYSTIILIDVMRDKSVINDLKYLTTTLFNVDERKLDIEIKDKDEVL